jgi:hypothetical protein
MSGVLRGKTERVRAMATGFREKCASAATRGRRWCDDAGKVVA